MDGSIKVIKGKEELANNSFGAEGIQVLGSGGDSRSFNSPEAAWKNALYQIYKNAYNLPDDNNQYGILPTVVKLRTYKGLLRR